MTETDQRSLTPQVKPAILRKKFIIIVGLLPLLFLVVWLVVLRIPSIQQNQSSKATQTTIAFKQTESASATQLAVFTTPPPCTEIGQEWVSPVDGMILVCVPAGSFIMGSDNEANEQPFHEVNMVAFWIDKTEVTNSMYQKCVEEGICSPPVFDVSYTRETYFSDPTYANYPVIYVDWNQATTYCTWASRLLPTEAQWEKAARGVDERLYPWGNESPNSVLANYGFIYQDTTKVSLFEKGISPYGIYDMAGNVWEWVADWYQEDYYSSNPDYEFIINPQGPGSGEFRVIRGGSWNFDKIYTTFRGMNFPDRGDSYIGFRCSK